MNAWSTYERLGSPEGGLAIIGQDVIYLACATKSNAVYNAFNQAMSHARESGSMEVPNHLRNAPTSFMKDLGYGKDYRYAHDENDAFAAGEKYFPDDMPVTRYYQPVDRGLEIRIAEKLSYLRNLNK